MTEEKYIVSDEDSKYSYAVQKHKKRERKVRLGNFRDLHNI